MICPKETFEQFADAGVEFFAGVPDSLLKHFCSYTSAIVPASNHIIAANEGAAVALAAGHYLGTGKIPLVYMQNSGLGNAVNPLLSLADPDVYAIPMLLLVGWRGEPGTHDEPQHVKQGRVMCAMLDAMEIGYFVLDGSMGSAGQVIEQAKNLAISRGAPVAILVRQGTFSECSANMIDKKPYNMSREQAIATITKAVKKRTAIICTTGKASRELYELRENSKDGHQSDFLTVGSMGHASSIAVGLSLSKPGRAVICIDGDGAALMHLGSLCINAQSSCSNFLHIVLNNGSHESVGAQPTVAFSSDLSAIASAAGYPRSIVVSDAFALEEKIVEFLKRPLGPSFIEVRIANGSRSNLGRPKEEPKINKQDLMDWLEHQG